MLLQMALVHSFSWLSSVPLDLLLSIHLSIDMYLGSFPVLAIVDSVAINIMVHVSFQIIILPGYMLRNGVARSYGNYV